jgi:hypothetical protein
MSEFNRLTPYGLTTLDIATGNVLRSFLTGDWENSLIHLKILAYTTGDKDIIELVEKHCKITANSKAQYGAGNEGITIAENVNISDKMQKYMQSRALDLYKELRIIMKDKKLISQGIEARYQTNDGVLGVNGQ